MSLVKLARDRNDVYYELGALKGRNWNGTSRGRLAQNTYDSHLNNAAELKAAKEAHTAARGLTTESDALAHLEKTRTKVQTSAGKLNALIYPGGKGAVMAGRSNLAVAPPVPTGVPASGNVATSLGGKIKDFAIKHPIGTAAGVAVGAYGLHKMLSDKNRQGQY